MPSQEVNGLLVLDKPVGITSREAVDRAMRWFPRKTRIGHTGTLDPLASGVLVLCVGRATRLTEYIQDMPKTYVAEFVLGARSATDDAEGPITPAAIEQLPGRNDVDAALASFTGTIEQVPPAFSAAKVAGRRSYDLARRGMATALAPRRVRVDQIEVIEFDYPHLRIEVHCGKGTYIRSLARDLGERLECGAYVYALRRIAVGPFSAAEAISLDADAASAGAKLFPPAAAVAGLTTITASHTDLNRLRHGQAIVSSETVPANADIALLTTGAVLVAIATADANGRTLRPTKVFEP